MFRVESAKCCGGGDRGYSSVRRGIIWSSCATGPDDFLTNERCRAMREPSTKHACWTHPSVQAIAREHDPVAFITDRARALVFSAFHEGWSGPPFDPCELANFLRMEVSANDNVLDARIAQTKGGRLRIEFNPNRVLSRVRYSIAHEIAHSLFPDCAGYTRERQLKGHMRGDDWQLEMLCNLGAAELLMPIGTFEELAKETLGIDRIMNLRSQYGVSTEALLLRIVKLTENPCLAFCCSARREGARAERYEIDYAVRSKGANKTIRSGDRLPQGSVVEECTAIGYTAKGEENWPGEVGKVHVDCVGLAPYPGHRYPRVAGIVSLGDQPSSVNRIVYLRGDATEPRGPGKKIIAFVINDKGRSWGAGFARAIQRKWPFVLDEFQTRMTQNRSEFVLGNVNRSVIDSETTVFEMIAQRGYGESNRPRIRYAALEACLKKLGKEASGSGASVHMPRIGCGQAGGSWLVVRELIESTLLQRGVRVNIYELPEGRAETRAGQMSLLDEARQ
jgi:Zn-dependent peptidase ImmA (M78 family)